VESEDRRLGRLESGMWKVGTFRVVVDPCGLMQDFFSLWSDFFLCFFYCYGPFVFAHVPEYVTFLIYDRVQF
jgi:hypothetical protein